MTEDVQVFASEKPLTCEVCGKPAAGVYASSMGAISHAYCRECAVAGREPWSTLIGGLVGRKRGQVADWAQLTIDATVAFYNKSEDELWAEVDRLEREFEAYMLADISHMTFEAFKEQVEAAGLTAEVTEEDPQMGPVWTIKGGIAEIPFCPIGLWEMKKQQGRDNWDGCIQTAIAQAKGM